MLLTPFSRDDFAELNKSGLYFQPPITIINSKNIIVILMSIELILLAVNINLVSFSIYLGDLSGQVFTLFILTVAAAEAAIGLAIIVVYFRNSGTIRVEEIDKLKG